MTYISLKLMLSPTFVSMQTHSRRRKAVVKSTLYIYIEHTSVSLYSTVVYKYSLVCRVSVVKSVGKSNDNERLAQTKIYF